MAKKKPLPLAAVIPLDLALFAGLLLSFAYFHHVNPLIKEKVETRKAAHRDSDIYGSSTTAAITALTGTTASSGTLAAVLSEDTQSVRTVMDTSAVLTVSSGSTGSPALTDVTVSSEGSTAETEQSAAITQQTDTQPTQTEPAKTEKASDPVTQKTAAATTKTTTTTTTTTTAAPEYDLSGWGAKFPEVFSLGDEVEADDTHYRSHNVYISVTDDWYADSAVHICDIYIRRFECFKSAFEHDEFKNGPQENMFDLAERKNAILAINGDFTGGRENGVIIREGSLFRDVARGDIGTLFDDGSFRSFSKDEVSTDWLLDNYAYDTMTFGPALVQDGSAADSSSWRSALAAKHPRSAFGYYEPGHYCFVAVDGRGMNDSEGVTAAQLADYMADKLGCAEAYNLDGGASSQIWFNGKLVNLPPGYNGEKRSLRGLTDIFYIGEAE